MRIKKLPLDIIDGIPVYPFFGADEENKMTSQRTTRTTTTRTMVTTMGMLNTGRYGSNPFVGSANSRRRRRSAMS